MVKTSGLSNEQRRQILALREDGFSMAQIAEHFQVCRQTVYRVCKHHRETENVDKRRRPGRGTKTTRLEDWFLLLQVHMTEFESAQTLAAHWSYSIGWMISKMTSQGRLYSHNIHARISGRKILISRVNRQRRTRWASGVRDWTV